MLKKLVLFDIDGTLLNMGPINRSVLADALRAVYGTEGSTRTHNFAGKMDSAIIFEVLQNGGLDEKEIAGSFDRARQTYIEMFRSQAGAADVTLIDGVRELLDQLRERSEVMLGLLTGNFEGSGRHKLKLPDIDRYFPFGAFADDGKSRNDLPKVAVEKAYRLTGKRFSNHDVIIIGDTEHDIACARTVNAKSIAVATGTYSMEELEKHDPHVLYENLSRTDAVISEILQTTIN